MVKRLHHINFLVRDLTQAIPKFAKLLGRPAGELESLPQRGVLLARFPVGETWVILVQPTDPRSEPGRYLAEHGEGFFLASFEVDNLEEAATTLEGENLCPPFSQSRKGLDDWRVLDLDPSPFNGVQLQLVQSASSVEKL